jgi:hypothetical protein
MRRTIVLLACAAALVGCSSAEDGKDFTGRSAASPSAAVTPREPAPKATDDGEEGLGTPDPAPTTEAAGPKSFTMGYKATISDDEVGDVLFITVAQPRTVKGDEFIKPEKGRFLAVTVTFEALAEAQDINPFDFLATTTAGERLQPTFGPDTGSTQLNSATLNNGEKAKGTVVFDVPAKGVIGIAYAPAGQVLGTWKLG